MARGDMRIDTLKVGVEEEILNRKEFQAVANTIDFSDVETKDVNGLKTVKAGTPIDKDGKPITSTPWTNAIGILLHDAYEDRPQTAILKQAYIHTTRAKTHTKLNYDGALVKALNMAGCRIVFEEPIILETV